MHSSVLAAFPTTMPGVTPRVTMGATCSSTSPKQDVSSNTDSFVGNGSCNRACLTPALPIFLVLLLATAAAAATATKLASENSNSVVQIDFSRRFDAINIPECARNQIINVTLADQEVACLLPRQASSGMEALDKLKQFLSDSPESDPEATELVAQSGNQDNSAEPEDCERPSRLSNELHIGSPELQSYMRAARLRWLLDRCFRFSDIGVRDWRYELCVGRKITLFKGSALTGKTVGKSLFELGTYAASRDQLWADGTMTQWYIGGTEGRQTEVTFVCGDTHPRVKGISGPVEGRYNVQLEAPMFCDFRENAPHPALSESLLRSLEGWCSTFTTDGWWSYEYCHPDSLVQYHNDADGELRGPMYLLGTLHASGDAAEMIFKKPNPANPTLRGTDTLPPKANGKPRFKFLPVQIVDRPLQVSKYPTPASNKVLALQLTNGTVCEGTEKQRSTRVLFECPIDFPVLATHRIVHIEETAFCSYDLTIHTPLVCPHPKLLPPRPLDAQEILGYPTERSFVHHVVPASWKGLAVAEPPVKTEEPVIKQRTSAQLEAVPEEALKLFQNGVSVNGFGLASYLRKRTSVQEPRFRIGEIVRHRWWQYIAVVVSWDTSCMADDTWSKKVYDLYPRDAYSRPHYLVLVDTGKDSAEGLPRYAYVPETGIEKMSGELPELTHPALHEFFEQFSKKEKRYILMRDSAFARNFPDDAAF